MIFYDIQFENAEFREGFNSTLRLGDKHYENLISIINSDTKCVMLKLNDNHDASKNRTGRLLSVERTTFDQITVTDCASNHVARNLIDLKIAMKRAYGRNINGSEVVTIIGFDVIKRDDGNYSGKDVPNIPRTLLSV